MELTGKCKAEFKKWWINFMDQVMSIHTFIQQHKSMQYGVYVDFFWFNKIPVAHDWIPIILKKINLEDYRIETIEKANQIYNDAH